MKQKLKKIALAIMCVIVCASVTITMCFADSHVNASTPTRVDVDNAPHSMLVYRSLNGTIVPMQCGNPFVYSYGVLPDTNNMWEGYNDFLAMYYNSQYGNTNLSLYSAYTYRHAQNHDYDIITTSFVTGDNDYSLNDGNVYALAFQLYYRNCYFYDDVNPSIDFYLDDDYSSVVDINISYRYYGINSDGNLALFSSTRVLPFRVTIDGSTYIHTLDFTDIFSHVDYNEDYPLNDGEALIEQMYIDINFSEAYAYYANSFAVRFNHSVHGASDVTFNEKFVEMSNIDIGADERPLAEWAFNAIENIIDYPLFYVGDVRVTPIAIFSLVFGLGLFAWLLKVFAGG